MSEVLEVTLRIRVDSQEEADKVMGSVYSGLAAEIVRVGALYGAVPIGGVAGVPQPPNSDTAEAKRREASIQLQDVEVKATRAINIAPEEKPKAAPKRSLAGMKRLGRT